MFISHRLKFFSNSPTGAKNLPPGNPLKFPPPTTLKSLMLHSETYSPTKMVVPQSKLCIRRYRRPQKMMMMILRMTTEPPPPPLSVRWRLLKSVSELSPRKTLNFFPS